ncbi:hypothetical protein HOLleu_18924 [Holothuria leucospilota]|uniref:Uncharacterized protein n=1 Tax=Holothuria leucospilota TaxID=206669 RepID=A0A9Q1C4J7_HOLLE|nr:hypothetical protein HOLleu_18924 [Holothuria leucospilota]
MDLYVRIPSNMHDVGIQASPCESMEPLPLADKIPRPPENKTYVTETAQVNEKLSQGSTVLSTVIAPDLNDLPPALTLALGDSQWCVGNSTPRPLSTDSPTHPRDKGRESERTNDQYNEQQPIKTPAFSLHSDRDCGIDPFKLQFITAQLGVTDWIKEKGEHIPLDLGRIKFIRPDIIAAERESRSESCPSVSSHTSGRSLNEPLDKYMVIRQRTFHGLPRSKKELRVLPLTDPRETKNEANPSWMHRSKTDLFIERRRNRIAAARRAYASKRQTFSDLDGITFAGLVENLPNVNQGHQEEPFEKEVDVNNNILPVGKPVYSNPSRTSENMNAKQHAIDSKLPPISLKQTQQNHSSPETKTKEQSSRNNSGSSSSSSGSNAPPNDSPRNKNQIRGKLRKQPLAAIPLKLWEPSFDCVVVSSRKVLQPRQLVKTWGPSEAPPRQQPSPLK